MMTRKILVFGATGNVGSELVSLLQERGANFVAGTTRDSIEGVENVVTVDFADVASLDKAMQGISTVFMLIPTHPEMIQWGRNVIRAAKKAGVKHIVRSSAFTAREGSPYKYMQKLHITDKDVIDSGLDYTVTLPQHFMQNFRNHHADEYKSGKLSHPARKGDIGWVDVRDIAAVNVEILLNPEKFKNQILKITGGECFSYSDAIGMMNSALARACQFIPISDAAAIKAMEEFHIPPFYIQVMMSLHNAVENGEADEISDTVKKVTGKAPISFDQYIEDNKSAWL